MRTATANAIRRCFTNEMPTQNYARKKPRCLSVAGFFVSMSDCCYAGQAIGAGLLARAGY